MQLMDNLRAAIESGKRFSEMLRLGEEWIARVGLRSEDREELCELIRSADVLITNFSGPTLEKHRLDAGQAAREACALKRTPSLHPQSLRVLRRQQEEYTLITH